MADGGPLPLCRRCCSLRTKRGGHQVATIVREVLSDGVPGQALPRCHSDSTVEADDLTVEHCVLDDVDG
jgi:hypothetical protein